MTEDTPGAPEASQPKFGRQQIIATVLTLIVLVLVFVVILPQFGDYSAPWDDIHDMEAYQLALLAAATIAMILIYVLPYPAALPGLKYWPAFKVRQTSFMISNVVPAGGAFGLAVQYGMLSSYGYAAAPTTAAIGITSVWNSLVTLSLPVLALLGLTITGQNTGDATVVTLIATAVVVGGVILLALILRSEDLARRIGGWGDSLVQWAA